MSDKSYRLETIEDAKTYVQAVAHTNDGGTCPCCGSYVKVYKRTINKNAITALAIIIKHSFKVVENKIEFNYIHIQEVFSKLGMRATSMDYIQLERFGLIEEMPDTRSKEEKKLLKNIGMWRPTMRGYDFFIGKVYIEKYHYVYNNETIKKSIKHVHVTDCFKERFKYTDILHTYDLMSLPKFL